MLPGERLRVMVSASGPVEARAIRLPGGEAASFAVEHLREAAPQPVRTGSHVRVDQDERLCPADGIAVSTWVWLPPGWEGGRRQRPGRDQRRTRSCLVPTGAPDSRSGHRRARRRSRPAAPLPARHLGPSRGSLRPGYRRDLGRGGRAGRSGGRWRARHNPGPACCSGRRRQPTGEATDHLDGKLDQPRIDVGPPEARRMVAGWALGIGPGRRGRRQRAERARRALRQRALPGGHRRRVGRERS